MLGKKLSINQSANQSINQSINQPTNQHLFPSVSLPTSDVGLAIARNALDTSNHYFEVTIVDPGENCYIAVGLVRKNYPKKRHPGWNKGSIAYHADDGKLFTGMLAVGYLELCHCGLTSRAEYEHSQGILGSSAFSGASGRGRQFGLVGSIRKSLKWDLKLDWKLN